VAPRPITVGAYSSLRETCARGCLTFVNTLGDDVFEDRDIVLDPAAVADRDVPDEAALPDRAALADPGLVHHVHPLPDPGVRADLRTVLDDRRGVDPLVRSLHRG